VQSLLRLTVKHVSRQVIREDVVVYEDVQRGLESSPHLGVLGTREERLYVFQEYVNRNCAQPTANGRCGEAHQTVD
jgi:hypothetical protein